MMEGDKPGKIGPGGNNMGFQITPQQGDEEKEYWGGKADSKPPFARFLFDGPDDILQSHAPFLYQMPSIDNLCQLRRPFSGG
jgi:hypothetical protein